MSDVGRATRREVPRSAHAGFTPAPDRDPIALLELQAAQREPTLVPLRHERMAISPFTYFRGAALPMAWDLARTPTTGITVQLCGDAHLSNFGMFGSPERHLYFDVNDFDETLPGPFEWDVKRLAASLEVAARERGFGAKQRRKTILSAVGAYREAMAGFAPMSSLDVWYAHLDVDRLIPEFLQALDRVRTPAVWKAITTARAHDSMQAFDRLTEIVDGEPRIVHDPPIVVPLGEAGRRRARPDPGVAGRDGLLVPADPPVGPTAPSVAVPPGRRRAQGGRGRERRYPLLDRAPAGSRIRLAAVPPGEGGAGLGPGELPAEEHLPQPRSSRGGRAATDAGHERPLPGLAATDVGETRSATTTSGSSGTGKGPRRWPT